mmetsp:Transcript_190/g.461  ORF Transcript_190/g.461 Transcript_190/m.461 type:complete len:513 (-) Transcript_190:144-1682(-)
MRPKLARSRIRHVSGHPDSLLKVPEALCRLLLQSPGDKFRSWTLNCTLLLLFVLRQEKISHVTECTVDLRDPCFVWLGVRVGLRGADGGAAWNTNASAGKACDCLVVGYQPPSCLSSCSTVTLHSPRFHPIPAGAQWVSPGPLLSVNFLPNLFLPSTGHRGTSPDLGREVVVVCVPVRLDVGERFPAVHRLKPPTNVRPSLRVKQQKPFVVRQRSRHSLHEGCEDDVHERKSSAEKKGSSPCFKLRLDSFQSCLELLLESLLTQRRPQPSEPISEQLPLKPHQRPKGLASGFRGIRNHRDRREFLLQYPYDIVRLCDDLLVNHGDWEHTPGSNLQEPLRFVSVAPHVDSLDDVGHFFFLQQEPNLLTVGTPGRHVSNEDNPGLFALLQVEHSPVCPVGGGSKTLLLEFCRLLLLCRLLRGQTRREFLPRGRFVFKFCGVSCLHPEGSLEEIERVQLERRTPVKRHSLRAGLHGNEGSGGSGQDNRHTNSTSQAHPPMVTPQSPHASKVHVSS